MGVRSFFEWRIKSVFHAIAGAEANYLAQFQQSGQLRHLGKWQPAAVAGLEIRYPIKKKINGGFQVLYNVQALKQVPRQSPWQLRFIYTKI